MADQPFTPHADSIQTAWVLMCQQSRVSTQPPVEELEAEFDRFIAQVKAEAWDEGCEAFEAAHKWDNTEPWEHLIGNPYRGEHTNG